MWDSVQFDVSHEIDTRMELVILSFRMLSIHFESF